MRKTNTKEFDLAYERFIAEKDAMVHKKAVETLLGIAGLKRSYREFLSEADSVGNFFLCLDQASKEAADPQEKASLKKLGILSRKLYGRHDYLKLLEVFFDVAFRHFAEHINLEKEKDFEKITDHDLYERGLIPDEIFLQFFLMEALVKADAFDWGRGEEIAKQNLACFIVCFGDLYGFFHKENEEQLMEAKNFKQIIEHRRNLEGEIMDMLKETGSDFKLAHVLDAIYNEEDSDDMMKVVAMFDCGGDAIELENVLELVADAWNYFPHKVLGGISPAEELLEDRNKNGKKE